MKDIPFYSNYQSKSCMLACMRSALEYLTQRSWTWPELEALTGFKPGRAAWTVKMWTTLAEDGFDIDMTEGFDYALYYKQGESYLSQFLKPHEVEWQLQNSNLLDIRPLIPVFLKTVRHNMASPTLKDVDRLLGEGYLVTVQLNNQILNDQSGYVAHMILVHDKQGEDYIAHDPGDDSAGEANRRIPAQKLFAAMGGKNNTTETTGIKYVKNN